MRRLLHAVSWMTVAQVASTLFRILNGKVLAVVLGPEGMGLLAQLYQFRDLVVQYTSLGIGPGIVKYTATGIVDERYTRVQRLISSTVTGLGALSVAAVLLCCLFVQRVSWLVFGSEDFYFFLLVFVPTLPLIVVGGILRNVLMGIKEVRKLALSMMAIVGLACAVTSALVLVLGLWGAVIAAALESGILILVYRFFLRRTDLAVKIWPQHILSFDWEMARSLFRFGLVTLLAGGIGTLATFLTRSLLIHRLGAGANGLYQAALVITIQSISMLTVAMSAYVSPRISELKENHPAIVGEKNNALRLCLLLGVPVLSLVLVTKEWLIPLLTSPEFLPATELLPIQALGCLFFLISWGIRIGLLVMERFVAWLAFSSLVSLARPLLFLLLLPSYGLLSIVIAYAVTEGMGAILSYVYHHREIGFRMTRRNARLTVIGLALVIVVSITSSMEGVLLRYVVPAGLLLVWALVAASKDEYLRAIQWVRDGLRFRQLDAGVDL